MAFDARQVWWPPARNLYNAFEKLQEDPSTLSAPDLQSLLDEASAALRRGLLFFSKQEFAAKQAVQTQAAFGLGTKKLPLDEALRSPAVSLANQLGINEAQSYVLLRRWAQEQGVEPKDVQHAHDWSQQVAIYYCAERSRFLCCIEAILAPGESSTACGEVLEATRQRLLKDGIVDNLIHALLAGLQAMSGKCPLPDSPAASAAILLAANLHEQAAVELTALLNLLIRIFFWNVDTWTPARLKLVGRAFQTDLFALPEDILVKSSDGPVQIDCLGVILLLGAGSLDVLLELMTREASFTAEVHLLGDPAVCQRVDEELQSWWPSANSSTGPLFLAFAAALSLSASLQGGSSGREEGPDFKGHAQKATQLGVLETIAAMASQAGQQDVSHDMRYTYSQTLLGLVSSTICAFGLTPSSLGSGDLSILVGILSCLFQGQQSLCDEFWEDHTTVCLPIWRFLDDCRDLAPAIMFPLLQLLSALATGQQAAFQAYQYLLELPGITSLHRRDDPSIQLQADAAAIATARLQLTNMPGVTLPQGIQGQVQGLPLSLASHESGSPAVEVLIRWHGPGLTHLGPTLVLAHAFQSLRYLQQAGPAEVVSDRMRDAESALSLLATLLRADPGLGLEMAQMPISGGSATDLPSMLAAALNLLGGLSKPPVHLIGTCLEIAAALARCIPGRIVTEMALTDLLQPGQGAMLPPGMLLEHGPLSMAFGQGVPGLQRLTSNFEERVGTFPVTLAFLHLTSTLLDGGLSGDTLQSWVGFVLRQIMGRQRHWQYLQRCERWEIAAAGLRVLHSCLCLPSGAAGLMRALAAELQVAGTPETSLLPALPPPAGSLNQVRMQRHVAESDFMEKLAAEWLQLLPNLLPAAADPSAGPALVYALFQARPGSAEAPVEVLLSYISYPYFSKDLQLEKLHTVAALAQAVACHPQLLRRPFISLFPVPPDGAKTGLDAASRAALLAPFALSVACESPKQLGAAVQVLHTAVTLHPSLAEALLLPTSLTDCGNSDSNKENQQREQSEPGQREGKKRANGKGPAAAAPPSASPSPSPSQNGCLDALWVLLQNNTDLMKESPATACHTLAALLSLWQAGPLTDRAVHLLMSQPGFWQAISDCFKAVQPGTSARAAGSTADRESEAWQLRTEAAALQLLVVQVHACTLPGANEAGPGWGAVDVVRRWMSQSSQVNPAGLLEHYISGHQQTGSALAGIHRASQAAALELIASVLPDKTLGKSLMAGPTLLADFRRRVQPIARSSRTDLASLREEAEDALHGWDIHRTGAVRHRLLQSVIDAGIPQLLLDAAQPPPIRALEHDMPSALNSSRPPAACSPEAFEQQIGSLLLPQLQLTSQMKERLGDLNSTLACSQARQACTTSFRCLISVMASESVPARERSLVDAQTAAGLLHGCLEALASGEGMSCAGLDPQRVHFGSSCYGWLASSLQATLETSRIAVCSWDSRDLQLPEADRASSSGPQMGSGISSTLASTTRWLQSRAGLAVIEPAAAKTLEDITSNMLLLSLRGLQALRTKPTTEVDLIQSQLEQQLPLVCRLCNDQAVPEHQLASLMSILALVAEQPRHLSSSWLPAIMGCLDIERQLQSAIAYATAAKQGGAQKRSQVVTAILSFLTAAAQHKQIATMLVEHSVLEFTTALADWLLSSQGAGLGAVDNVSDNVSGQIDSSDNRVGHVQAGLVDTAGAYTPSTGRSIAHQHWCSLLGLQGTLLRTLVGNSQVQEGSMTMLVAAEPRIALAVQPPAGSPSQPLTLAGLQEADRALYLLTALAPLAGQWLLTLPTSISDLRTAAARFITFAALPSTSPATHLSCPPCSPAEKKLENQSASLPLLEGWFQSCAEGTKPPRERAASSARQRSWSPLASGSFGARGLSHSPTPTSPNPRLLHGASGSPARESSVLGDSPTHFRSRSREARSPRGGSQRLTFSEPQQPTEFSACLAESLYGCAAQALLFLAATSPSMSATEAAQGLGPQWPCPSALHGLQVQCTQLQPSVVHEVREGSTRAARLCKTLHLVASACEALLDAMHVPQAADFQQELQTSMKALDVATRHPARHQ
ncbi:hypothetical protein WJX74_000856 [Apatococcus lobatus]|uniref:Non-specific serine/threonine protein kinase n=1 Tax=Apatococcus lobatus TaxID=904363 RepID=A0AAW1SAS3_9CHLO